MRILLTNSFLASRTGSEMAVRDFAVGLKRRNHAIEVYANVLTKAWRENLARHGIRAVDRIEDLQQRPDVVHGQHTIAFLPCMIRFPDAGVVQWIHDIRDPIDTPLGHCAIAHHVAVDEFRADRVAEALGTRDHVSVVANAVDLSRFSPHGLSADRRALCILKRDGLERTRDVIAQAAAKTGWSAHFAGPGAGHEILNMPDTLRQFDLVVTSGRCALEALAMGRAVIACDGNRLGGLVTEDTWARLRRNNIGLNAMTAVLNEDNALKEFAAVDLERTWAFASQIRGEIDLEPRLDEIERLYRHVNRTHDPLLDRTARSAWATDVERVAHAYAGHHLTHWRSVAAAADAADQSALF
jgi:hypothetical protein